MANKLYLTVVSDALPQRDAILQPDKLPLMLGNEDENLACGACKNVIARNVSTRTVHQRFGTAGGRLIARCPCGADNVLPAPDFGEDYQGGSVKPPGH